MYPLWLCPVRGTRTPQYLACHQVEDIKEVPEHETADSQEGGEGNEGSTETFQDGEERDEGERSGSNDFINIGIYGRPRSFPYDVPRTNTHLIDMLLRFHARSMLYAQTWHTEDQWKAISSGAIQEVERVKKKYGSDSFSGCTTRCLSARKTGRGGNWECR